MAKNQEESVIEKGILIAAISSIIIIFLIIIFIFREGLPAFDTIGFFNFIFGMVWNPDYNIYGVFPMIIGSLYLMALSLIMAIPFAVFGAIFLAEVAPKRMRSILKPTIQTLAGIPSVIYGFFGLIVLVPLIRTQFGGSGFSLFTASLILTVMILPTILSVSEDAIKSVPLEYKEAS